MKIIAIGDNVCDKYLSRGKMYPGGQCINTCVYAGMNGVEAAYLGKFGNDEVAGRVQSILRKLAIDMSRCRHFEGENGYACVTLRNNDRVFVGSNQGGVAKEKPYDFGEEDYSYVKGFDLVYTNLNAYIEKDLPNIHATGVPVAFDFSNRWSDEYMQLICPYIEIASLSTEHLDDEARKQEMKKMAELGVSLVLGTAGESGSYLLYKGEYYYTPAVKPDAILDTMGAGDSYFATFLCHLLKAFEAYGCGCDFKAIEPQILQEAMRRGAEFAAKICGMEGAFGYGCDIVGD